MEHPPKQGLKQPFEFEYKQEKIQVLMEHPPKQGLKQSNFSSPSKVKQVLMEHPPKQGLKQASIACVASKPEGFNGTSTKTRIETRSGRTLTQEPFRVLMEHPPKQGLKQSNFIGFLINT